MDERYLNITCNPDWQEVLRETGRKIEIGVATHTYQGETLNFGTPETYFTRLTDHRWQLIRLLQGAGAMPVRELARRAGRDVKRVHGDVVVLAELGLVERTSRGGVVCPFRSIHIDMEIRAPGDVAA